MKTSTKKIMMIEFVLLVFLILNIFSIQMKNLYLFSLILLIPLGVSIWLLGYEKNRQRFQKDIILNIIIYTVLFQMMLYIGGLFLGFIQNGYSLSIINMMKNMLPIIFVIIVSELFRYVINVKGQNNSYLIFLSMIIFVLIDVSLQIHLYDIQTLKGLIELGCVIVLPSIAKNILLTYFSLQFGFQSTIFYRFMMELSIYFMPIMPDLNIYLKSVLSFLFPLFVLYITHCSFGKKETKIEVHKHGITKVVSVVFILFLLFVVGLTSGVFHYYSLTIGSGSMMPTIHKGDVVIVEKISKNKISTLKENDILIFEQGNKVVVHRIVEVQEENHVYSFKTKGDNNAHIDDWIVTQKQVIGKAKLKIPYVGYPTVWLNERMN